MPISIGSLPVVTLDYAHRGPELHSGLTRLQTLLESEKGRQGCLLVNVAVTGAVIPVVMARADLYVMGFRCGGTWFRFDDAEWPFSETATRLGYDGQYGSLGGLRGNLTLGGIGGIARLANLADRPHWKEALRTLLVVVCECSRLVPIHMQIVGLLNGAIPFVPLAPMAHYIKNWDKASKGTDMSREVGVNLRTGFKDPSIIRR